MLDIFLAEKNILKSELKINDFLKNMNNKDSKPDNNIKLKNSSNDTDKNAYSILKNKNYKKTEIVKDDGRYLIYYDFSDS